MNILFITPSLPSRLHRVRAVNLMKYLSRRHTIHLVSLAHPSQKEFELEEIRSYCASVTIIHMGTIQSWLLSALYLFTPMPLEVAYTKNRAMNTAVREVLRNEDIDVIYVKRLRAVQYVDPVITVPVVIDTTDAMSLFYNRARTQVHGLQRLLFTEEAFAYRLYERRVAKRFSHWIACSPVDQAYLQKRLPRISVDVIPNGVDTEYYHNDGTQPRPHTIMFSGLMNKFVNISAALYFVRKVFPLVLKRLPNAQLSIFGPRPTASIRAYNRHPNIEVRGFMTDLRPQILQHQIVVCPILVGTGTRNKILQAWSLGRPVVSTSQGASGLAVRDGENIFIADDPSSFAGAIIKLLEHPAVRDRFTKEGRRTVEEKYSMRIVTDQLDAYLSSITKP